MTIIESEIREWVPVSLAQREIQEETVALLTQEGFTPPPLVCRTHHIMDLILLSEFWLSQEWSEPWVHSDFNILLNTIHSVAKGYAFATINMYKNDAFSDVFDVIGKSHESEVASRRSFYLFGMNFLLRASQFPDALITFNANPDRICASCKGGINEFGTHCRDVALTRFDMDHMDNRIGTVLDILRNRNGFEISKLSNGYIHPMSFELSYRTLFDPNFISAVEQEKFRRIR